MNSHTPIDEDGELRLPDGWVEAPLPLVFDVNPRKPPADVLPEQAKVSFVPMAAVEAERGLITDPETKLFGDVRKGYTGFRDNDVILAKITPCFENGKAAIARDLVNGWGFGSTEFHVFRPIGAVTSEYLFHFLRQERFRSIAAEHMRGTAGQERVPADYLERIVLPVPPLSEQRRIVTKVEALLLRIGEIKAHLERASLILERFRRSVLAAACSGRLSEIWRREHSDVESATELLERIKRNRNSGGKVRSTRVSDEITEVPETELPTGWTWCRVDDVARVCLGGTPSRNEPRYWGGRIPWVSSGEVANCRISDTREKITKVGLENSNAKLYPRGTVLIAMIGEGKTRGQSAILDIEACTNQNAAGLVVDRPGMDPEYLWRWALGEYERTRDVGRGGNQPALNGQKVRELAIPLPPLAEQEEIVGRLEGLLHLVEVIERRVTASALRADNTVQAVLTKAFSGELVPTEAQLARQDGRDYEPASVLLERIQIERNGGRLATKEEHTASNTKRRVIPQRTRALSVRRRGLVRKESGKKPPQTAR